MSKSERKFEEKIEKATGIKMPEPTSPGQVEHPKPKPMGVYSTIIRKTKTK